MDFFAEWQNQWAAAQTEYDAKQQKLARWANQFNELQQEVKDLIVVFNYEYEQNKIKAGLPDEIADKLQSRLEGIRLSAKSVSRLPNKWPVFNAVQEAGESFRSWESVKAELEALLQQAGEAEEQAERQEGESAGEAAVRQEEAVGEELPSIEFADTGDTVGNQAGIDSEEYGSVNQPTVFGESVRFDSSEKNDSFVDLQANAELQEIADSPATTEPLAYTPAQQDLAEQILHEAFEANQQELERLSATLEQVEKKFVNFVEKSLAPIMDGLYNGSKYAEDFVREIEQQQPQDVLYYVQYWVQIYAKLMAKLEQVLNRLAVTLLIPQIGESFDEQFHEPITVVEDPELSDEQIKEVVRYGYVCKDEVFGQTEFLIRPAQVIVVKNRGGQHAV